MTIKAYPTHEQRNALPVSEAAPKKAGEHEAIAIASKLAVTKASDTPDWKWIFDLRPQALSLDERFMLIDGILSHKQEKSVTTTDCLQLINRHLLDGIGDYTQKIPDDPKMRTVADRILEMLQGATAVTPFDQNKTSADVHDTLFSTFYLENHRPRPDECTHNADRSTGLHRPLFLALSNGLRQSAEILVEKNAYTPEQLTAALTLCCSRNEMSDIRNIYILIQCGGSLHEKLGDKTAGHHLLKKTIGHAHFATALYLMENGFSLATDEISELKKECLNVISAFPTSILLDMMQRKLQRSARAQFKNAQRHKRNADRKEARAIKAALAAPYKFRLKPGGGS